MHQTVTVTFYRFESLADKFWAFKMMQLAHSPLKKVAGLTFYKLLGTGGGEGFSWKPDFGVYCLMGVWESEAAAKHFIEKANISKKYSKHAKEEITYWLNPLEAHGFWSGKQPFKFNKQQINLPVVVLTRARIFLKHVPAFWQKVAPSSNSIIGFKGKLFSKGVGEWPLIQQATISIWENIEAMKAYAYRNPAHMEVVKLTRQKGWYKEEMFARFQLYHSTGSWYGTNPIKDYMASATTV
jgi:heme-degrading monooxygenase HmoA